HISLLIGSLSEHIRSPDRKSLSSSLLDLRASLSSAAVPPNSLQVVLFSFQDAVKKVLRQQQVKPHWMFALDNLLRQAVQEAITVLLPELKLQLQSSFEADDITAPPYKELLAVPPSVQQVVPEDTCQQTETADDLGGHVDDPGGHRDDSPLLLAFSCPLSVQLAELRQETQRLLHQLKEKETEYQDLLRTSVQRTHHEIQVLKNSSTPTGDPASFTGDSAASTGDSAASTDGLVSPRMDSSVPEDEALVHWLRALPVDQDTVCKLLSHRFSLDCLLEDACREDLVYCGIRGGMLCRVWAAVTATRDTGLGTIREESGEAVR
ncbi:hypothetical protein CRUP_035174, partial [Coryphaenoides rupestris]